MAMKYMLMTYGDQSTLSGRSPDWIKGMIDFMKRIDVELTESGELVFQQGLADPSEAKTVKALGGDSVVTDGPLMEPQQSLAGFWIVDVESEARAIAIADRIAKAAESPIEVRKCMDAPPTDVLDQGG
jgi:hypothetical protein